MQNRIERLRRARRSRGMTLIEIMVVLVILGLIAGAIGYNVFGQLREAQIKTAKLDLQAISNGVDLYHVETGNWPDGLQQLVPKYIKDLHKDPWGSQYSYVRTGEGFDAEDVRNALDISETNQRVLLHRARSKVRRALEEYLA